MDARDVFALRQFSLAQGPGETDGHAAPRLRAICLCLQRIGGAVWLHLWIEKDLLAARLLRSSMPDGGGSGITFFPVFDVFHTLRPLR
jgi:hypothetical protein